MCRLLFAAAGVEFEDVIIKINVKNTGETRSWNPEEWLKHKPLTPLGQLPYLEIINQDGDIIKISQSLAICKICFLVQIIYNLNLISYSASIGR